MLTIIDKYILKRYLATFAVMLLLFIPIGIVVDVSEKINKMLENKIPFLEMRCTTIILRFILRILF
jgi:lipopolysaccharide export system permease protein